MKNKIIFLLFYYFIYNINSIFLKEDIPEDWKIRYENGNLLFTKNEPNNQRMPSSF